MFSYILVRTKIPALAPLAERHVSMATDRDKKGLVSLIENESLKRGVALGFHLTPEFTMETHKCVLVCCSLTMS